MPATSLHDLPIELLYPICTRLDQSPPSDRNFYALPNAARTSSNERHLKSISEVSNRLRCCVLPLLFKHARFDTNRLTDFLEFVTRYNLSCHITSITANVSDPYNETHPAWYSRVLNEVRPLKLTTCCKPAAYRDLTGMDVVGHNDDWAFQIPFQVLELCQGPDAAALDVNYDEDIPGLLDVKPWYSMRFHEGSSVSAYTTFEYFFKQPPSIMLNIQTFLRSTSMQLTRPMASSMTSSKIRSSPVSIRTSLSKLREFTYVAVFPFYNNFDKVLACVREMVSIKSLTIKLCSDPESGVFEEELEAAGSHFDINDPWNEVNTAYNLLPHTITFLQENGNLEQVTMEDIDIDAIKVSIVASFSSIADSWRYDGNKTWYKIDADTGR